MKAIEYLEIKLKELFLKFEEIQIRYEFRENTNSHLVEIIPSSLFEKNETYLKEESKIEDEFEDLFPTENIVFITKGSLTEIKKVDLTFGYDKITFNNDYMPYEIIVWEGYSETMVAPCGENNYALAA
jgi:hypothetical protein